MSEETNEILERLKMLSLADSKELIKQMLWNFKIQIGFMFSNLSLYRR